MNRLPSAEFWLQAQGRRTIMAEGNEPRDAEEEEGLRPQQGGEGGTTRFGMEDGDNSDLPATGGPAPDDQAAEDQAAERAS
jgi:hypothetical protein